MPNENIVQIIQREFLRLQAKTGAGISPAPSISQPIDPAKSQLPDKSSAPFFYVTDYIKDRGTELIATTIAFVDGGGSRDTITDSANGLAIFKIGQLVKISGTTNNDAEVLIYAAASDGSSLTVDFNTTFTNESAGSSFTLSASRTPELLDFMTEQLPEAQQADDAFNLQVTWIQAGNVIERYIPQHTNRRYSTFLTSESFSGGSLAVLHLKWEGDFRILITEDSGVEREIASNSQDRNNLDVDSDRFLFDNTEIITATIPLRRGKVRLDVLLYNDLPDLGRFELKIRSREVFASAAPVPQMRMGTVQKTLQAVGDGAWHDDVAFDVEVSATTISFAQEIVTASTISMVDPFSHDNFMTFASTTITRTAGSFVTDGFEANMNVTVAGSSANDGSFAVTLVTALVLTISGGSAETGDKFKFITIKGQACIKDSGNGFGNFSDGDDIKVTGTTENDDTYTIDDALAGILVLVAANQLSTEAVGASVTVKGRGAIADSGSGFGSFSSGDPITVVGTVSNDGIYVVETAAAAQLDLEFTDRDLATESAGTSFTIQQGAITHHGSSDGVNFLVREATLIPQIVELFPNDYFVRGTEVDKQGVAIADPVIHGNSDNESSHTHTADGTLATDSEAAHTHSDGSLATDSDSHSHSSAGDHNHGGEVSSDGSHTHPSDAHTHDVTGSTAVGSSHSHDVTGNTSAGGAHNHTVNVSNDDDLDLDDVEIKDNGSKTHKDKVRISNPLVRDPGDTNFAQIEVLKTNDLIDPAQVAKQTGTTISFDDVLYAAATISFVLPSLVRDTGISFVNSSRKIIRAAGDWTTDGFEAGMSIVVRDSIENNNGEFTILSLTATDITLATTDVVQDESVGARISIEGQGTILDSANQFVVEKFEPGMSVLITNALANGGIVRISSVAAGKMTLELKTNPIIAESAGNTISLHGNPKISDSGNGLVTSGFVVNSTLTVSGASTAANNDTFTIEKVAAGYILLRLSEILTTEAAGATVTLKAHSKTGFGVRYKIQTGKTVRITYTALAWGYAPDRPLGVL